MTALEKSPCHLQTFVDKVSEAVRLGDVAAITRQVKNCLETFISTGRLNLPDDCRVPLEGTYARRLLHHDPELGYVVVAMAWAPGQSTALHDHDGIWCVEGVVEGEIHVSHFELKEKKEDLFLFEAAGETRACVGGAGALIPPHEHHLLSNALKDQTSVTLHIYGGEINRCNTFVPQGGNWYRREVRELSYHNEKTFVIQAEN